MMRGFAVLALAGMLAGTPPAADGAELIMVEEHGCVWCAAWNEAIAPIYPKTPEGAFAPLRRVDIHDPFPEDLTFASRPVFTPTFVLVEDGQEVARIEGYPGEDFFWGLLDRILTDNTDYERPES